MILRETCHTSKRKVASQESLLTRSTVVVVVSKTGETRWQVGMTCEQIDEYNFLDNFKFANFRAIKRKSLAAIDTH